MTQSNTTNEFRIAVEEKENAYFTYDDHDVFPTQIVCEDGEVHINARVTVTPTSDERIGEITDFAQTVFGEGVSVSYEQTNHIENADIPHTVDCYHVDVEGFVWEYFLKLYY